MSEINVNIPDLVGGGYGKFWKFEGRYRVCKGSRASKKSTTTALNLIYRLMKYPEANLLVVRQVANTLKDSCWADLKWAANKLNVSHLWDFTKSPLEATFKPTGQKILFRGLDDASRLASITVTVGYLCWCWIEEAFELENEDDFDMIDESIRGEMPEGYFKQITLTFNPWSESHWLKKRFFDCNPDPDILAMTTNYMCNEWLDDADRKKLESLKESNPTRYRVAGLGEWGIDGGAVFEEWQNDERGYKTRIGTHVIDPFEIPEDWRIYRGFDFGYAKPFSIGWWACDHDGRLYRILELYGCTEDPNTGVKWTPDQIFAKVYEIEHEHRWLKDKKIIGIADPSIWDVSRGISVAETAEKNRVYFDPGDNHRIAGWMQVHYRLAMDESGIPMMYVFKTCKDFIRTVPALKYDKNAVEDVDTDMEDHIADEMRYVFMARPINPKVVAPAQKLAYDPLSIDEETRHDRYDFYRVY